ncbi:isochorismate synthase [Aeromicrobium marinum DSM 15272]|uniref:isochorismate synthase n=1 Tax=Aeromicrobium marinum DSM 15272 TaxID=585531 RepID=E2SF27_9ACTN|nr:isochorismate synthase [Aeromicrobium marinum]EFQ82271.1 isochorismate synthase [Aeromicrobium marinum DSM 15272]
MSNPAASETSAAHALLLVRTVEVPDPGALLDLLPPGPESLAWVHGQDGIVGWGRAAGLEVSGRWRFDEARRWWEQTVEHAVVRDEIGRPGSGLVAFGSFDFAADGSGALHVPAVVVGRRDGVCWLSVIGPTITAVPELAPAEPPHAPQGTDLQDGPVDAEQWMAVVAEAIARIGADRLDKVVLARERLARFERPLDVRWPLRRLAREYPACWTFHVDGFFGSTPEMLVRLERGLVTSRVLAGTIRRTGDDAHDAALAGSLARSSKDLEEHEYAVRSVTDALAPHCTAMSVPDAPFVLHLPNVMHLATDVTGVVRSHTSALTLAAALHPSAAVGGTPTPDAVRLIAEIERLDRGRYAGPVGWIGAGGDGEWGIGLRSAEITDDGLTARLFAGCGIVADSVPADELAESDAKFVPVRDALS